MTYLHKEKEKNKFNKCKWADINSKGFCDNVIFNEGLYYCTKDEFDGRKVTSLLGCPHAY